MTKLVNRRTFLQSAAVAAASQAFAPALRALATPPAEFAWIAGEGGIHCLRGSRLGWLHTAFVKCEVPSALAIHAASRTLYVTHATEKYACLPMGSVSSYRVLENGGLEFLHRQQLSLACIRPDAVTVSPAGDRLVVASSSAGILNVLPLNKKVMPFAVTAVRKELSWASLGQQSSSDLVLRFVDETLLAQSGAHAMRYRCTLDELSPLGEIDQSIPKQNVLPSLVKDAIPHGFAFASRPQAVVML